MKKTSFFTECHLSCLAGVKTWKVSYQAPEGLSIRSRFLFSFLHPGSYIWFPSVHLIDDFIKKLIFIS